MCPPGRATVASPQMPYPQTSARALPATWVAVLFGLLTGVMLVYFPYEFGAPVFRFIYPDARLLGTGFLTGALLVGVAGLYREWPRGVDLCGRAVFLTALGAFWWKAAVANGAYTGVWCYAVLAAFVAYEAWRPSARTFVGFAGLTAFGLGGLLLAGPALLHDGLYRAVEPFALPLGGAFIATSVLLAVGWRRGNAHLFRAGVWALLGAFAVLAGALLSTRSWTGAAMYGSTALGLGLSALPIKWRAQGGMRWQLWRGMVIASCVPLIALGAVACVLMQRSLEEQALGESITAADGEVEWLDQHFDGERDSLLAHARLDSFKEAVLARDVELLELSLQVLRFHGLDFEAVFVLDREGQVLARTVDGIPRTADQRERDYFLEALATEDIFLSVPYVGLDALPRVAMSAPMRDGADIVGVLVGTISLSTLSGEHTLASQHYQIQLVDRRTGNLLRETTTGSVGVPAWLPPPLVEGLPETERGTYVGPDSSQQQAMVAWSRVPGTDWVVVARQPAEAAYRAVTRLGMGAALFVTIGAVLALFVSHLVASAVTARLGRVRAAASALAAGDLGVRVERGADDELGALAEAFNQMGSRVEAAQADLQRSNEELKNAVAIRDQFLSLASHELRTPLTPLKATVQTLRLLLQREGARLDPKRVAVMLDRADRQTDRLRLLVTDMLDTARIQAGRFVLQPERLDLAALVEDVVERHQAAHPHVAERLLVIRPEQPVEGVWDGHRLEQVVVNLLENALRYSPNGGPVRLLVEADEAHARLIVKDTGIGIPTESLPHLFEPFFRAPNAAEKHFGGLGLGLHICREIALRHGGDIWAESGGPGTGSRFCLELPRRMVTAPGSEGAAGGDTGSSESSEPTDHRAA